MYRALFALLRRLPAEGAHRLVMLGLRALCALPGAARLLRRLLVPRDPTLRVRVLGMELAGPLCVAAGFDKNAVAADALGALGFGAVEVGTVTARAQPGNPPPRVFRARPRALVNRMGFPNRGAAWVARHLAQHPPRTPIGINIGRSRTATDAETVDDYLESARLLAPHARYLVVNVSSPNTPGLTALQAVEQLRPLLVAVRDAIGDRLPLLVKISPDLGDAEVDAVADLATELGLDGIVATNTTISREGLEGDARPLGAGGLSGAPLKARSLEVLRRLRARTGGAMTLVAAGGIEDGEDAWERVAAGATLLQAYTGFVYGGPLWPRRVQRDLARRIRAAGFGSLAEAVGCAATAPPQPAASAGRPSGTALAH